MAKINDALNAIIEARNEEVAAEDLRLAGALDSFRSLMVETGWQSDDKLAAGIRKTWDDLMR